MYKIKSKYLIIDVFSYSSSRNSIFTILHNTNTNTRNFLIQNLFLVSTAFPLIIKEVENIENMPLDIKDNPNILIKINAPVGFYKLRRFSFGLTNLHSVNLSYPTVYTSTNYDVGDALRLQSVLIPLNLREITFTDVYDIIIPISDIIEPLKSLQRINIKMGLPEKGSKPPFVNDASVKTVFIKTLTVDVNDIRVFTHWIRSINSKRELIIKTEEVHLSGIIEAIGN